MKWQTVQLWRRRRGDRVSFALRYGPRDRPKTVGLGFCTEEYAEAKRVELEGTLNGPEPVAVFDEFVERMRAAGFGDDQTALVWSSLLPMFGRLASVSGPDSLAASETSGQHP